MEKVIGASLKDLRHGGDAIESYVGGTALNIYRNADFGIVVYRIRPLNIIELRELLPGFVQVQSFAFGSFVFSYTNIDGSLQTVDVPNGKANLHWISLGQNLEIAERNAKNTDPRFELVQLISIFEQYQLIAVGDEKRTEFGPGAKYMIWNGLVVKNHGYFGMKLFVK